jgi:tetratricopeptide (TPR) repeat protein
MKQICLSLALCLLFLSGAQAGIYSNEEPVLIRVAGDGFAEELSFSASEAGPFRIRINTLMNWLDSNPARKNTDREALIQKLNSPTVPFTKAAILLRLGKSDEALNTLAPLRRSRTPDFRVLMNLAHIHALRGEWPEARRAHEEAILDAEMPADLLPNITADQRKWFKRVEKEYYGRWLRIREQREQDRIKRITRQEEEKIFPLFGELSFEVSGRYAPGQISPEEKAKLPKDAIAIVQQLLLWEPNDTGLYWLLGELYAANGKFREALAIFDNCTSESRQYSNRLILKAHRAAVREAVQKLPEESPLLDTPLESPEAAKTSEDFMPSRTAWIIAGVVFGLFTITMLVLKLRTLFHSRQNSSQTHG